jgi:hypothetical protein
MKSNVKLRSNVYLRLPINIRDDRVFRSQVHGREALRKLLNRLETYDTPERASRWLTSYQAQEWAETTRCADCETQVIGPVQDHASLTHRVHTEFRCPRGVCPHQKGGSGS